MSQYVKTQVAKTKISSKHQVTIAKGPFEEAGLKAGQVVTVRAVGPGRVELTTLESLMEKHRGRIATGGEWRRAVEEIHDSWD